MLNKKNIKIISLILCVIFAIIIIILNNIKLFNKSKMLNKNNLSKEIEFGTYEKYTNLLSKISSSREMGTLDSCTIKIEENGKLIIENNENIKAFFIYRNGEFLKSVLGNSYLINGTLGEDELYYIIATDNNGKIYKSNEIRYSAKCYYLYLNGKDNTDITGGWQVWSQSYCNGIDLSNEKYLFASEIGQTNHFGHVYIRTKNKINLENVSKYEIEMAFSSNGSDMGCFYGFSNTFAYGSHSLVIPNNGCFVRTQTRYDNFTKITGNIDESYRVNDTYYFMFGGYSGNGIQNQYKIRNVKIY